MNKAELIASVAEKTGFTKKDPEKALNAILDAWTGEWVEGENGPLVGFGTFAVIDV